MIPRYPYTHRDGWGSTPAEEDIQPSTSAAGTQKHPLPVPTSRKQDPSSGSDTIGFGSTPHNTIPEDSNSERSTSPHQDQLDRLCLDKTSAALSKAVSFYQELITNLHQVNNRGEDVASIMQLVTKCRLLLESKLSFLDWHTLCSCTSQQERALLMFLFPSAQQKKTLSSQQHENTVRDFMCFSPPMGILANRIIEKICVKIAPVLNEENCHTTEQLMEYLLLHYGARNITTICRKLSRRKRDQPLDTTVPLQNAAQKVVEAFLESTYPPAILCAAYHQSLLSTYQMVSANLNSISTTVPLTHQQASALCCLLKKCNQLTLTVQDLSRLTPTDRKHHFFILAQIMKCLHKMHSCHITIENLQGYQMVLTTIRHTGYSRIKKTVVPLLEMCLTQSTLRARDCLIIFLSTSDGEWGLICFLNMLAALLQYTELSQTCVGPCDPYAAFTKILKTVTANDTSAEIARHTQNILDKKITLLQFVNTCTHAFPTVRATTEQHQRITSAKNCLISLLQQYVSPSFTVQEIKQYSTKKWCCKELPPLSSECAESVALFIGGIVINKMQYIYRSCYLDHLPAQKLLMHWNTTQNRQSPFTPENSLICRREITLSKKERKWLSENNTIFVPMTALCAEVCSLFSISVRGIFVDGNFVQDLHRDSYSINGQPIEKDQQHANSAEVNGTALSMLEKIIVALFRSGATEEDVQQRLLSISRLAHQGMAAVLTVTVARTTLFRTTCPTKIEMFGGGPRCVQEYNLCITPQGDSCQFAYHRQKITVSNAYQSDEVEDGSCKLLRKVTYSHGHDSRGCLMNNEAFLSLSMNVAVGAQGFINGVQEILYTIRMFAEHTTDNSTIYTQRGTEKPEILLEERSSLCLEKIL